MTEAGPGAEAYAELHAHSGFSFLDGSSDPEELVAEADRLGLEALALTDHHGFYGVVRFAEAARACGAAHRLRHRGDAGSGRPAHRRARPDRDAPRGAGPGPRRATRRLSTVLADAHLEGGEKGRPVFTLDALASAAAATGWC